MKKALLITCIAFTSLCGLSAMAFDHSQSTTPKTVLKQTNHAAFCKTPTGKLKKECAQNTDTASTHKYSH